MSSVPPATMLISGTSRGIGKYLAAYYAARGNRVYGCSRTQAGWQAENYTHTTLDIADEAAVKTLFARIRKESGRLDVLINNAAISPAVAPAILTSIAALRSALDTNVVGTYLLAREAAKLMMKHRYGRIINMSSMAAHHHVAGETVYTATKAAVVAFSRVFAKEVYAHGITCNVLAPAAVPTDLSAAIDPAALSAVLERNAIPAMGDLTDVSNATDWLIRSESHAVTGQVIYLGGV